jgi:heme A synthase
MSLSQIHGALANACLIFSLIIAAYATWRYLRKQGIDANFWGVLAAGELLFLAQGVVGVLLLIGGLQAARTVVHALYGIVLVISLPGTYALTRGRDTRREAGIYAVIGLFLAGITLRAMYTALH